MNILCPEGKISMRGQNKIRWYLIVRDIALKELAANAGISYSQLYKIMKNEVSPRYSTMLLIANALDENVWNVFFDGQQNSEYKIIKYEGRMDAEERNRIKAIANNKGVPLKELAINSGVSYSELIRIINGKSSPVFETMLLIADALRENVWDVFW